MEELPMIIPSFEFCFQFSNNPFNEPGELGRSWGRFAIDLDGTPLFRECGTNKPGLEWNLLYLRDWLTDLFWKSIEPNPVAAASWPGALCYRKYLDESLDKTTTKKQEAALIEQWAWLSSKNIWHVGQGVRSPAIFFVVDEARQLVEISWDQEENRERGFQTPPSDRVFVKLFRFRMEVAKFLTAYYRVVGSQGNSRPVPTKRSNHTLAKVATSRRYSTIGTT